MVINSLSFLAFFSVLFIIYWAAGGSIRKYVLFIGNVVFCLSWSISALAYIIGFAVVGYAAGRLCEGSSKKKAAFTAVTAFLAVLVTVKYSSFIAGILQPVINAVGIKFSASTLKIVLPVGLSFYTFKSISYVVDCYKGKIQSEHNMITYFNYVAFFPQLICGPIERAERLIPELNEYKIFDYNQVTYGLKLTFWGMFKKMAIADAIAGYVDKVYADVPSKSGFVFIIAAVFYSFQIYCDFSGYSDMAIGAAKMLGIETKKNFDSPYFSSSIQEFWRRWHISLSKWFCDYVYIPCGGSRCSKIKYYRNLMLTFLASGLWHGANWTFIVWGGIHGALQIIESFFRKKKTKNEEILPVRSGAVKVLYAVKHWISVLLVFVLVTIAWVFFRANSLSDAFYILTHAFSGIGDIKLYLVNAYYAFGLEPFGYIQLFVPIILLLIHDYAELKGDVIEQIGFMTEKKRWVIYCLVIALFLSLCSIFGVNSGDFIYSKF